MFFHTTDAWFQCCDCRGIGGLQFQQPLFVLQFHWIALAASSVSMIALLAPCNYFPLGFGRQANPSGGDFKASECHRLGLERHVCVTRACIPCILSFDEFGSLGFFLFTPLMNSFNVVGELTNHCHGSVWYFLQTGEFGEDNRAGIDRTLHRVSAMRTRSGRVVGLTCRVGRAISGSAEMVRDLVASNGSLLLMGPPGVGKTTAIR